MAQMNLNFKLKHLLAKLLPNSFTVRYMARLPQFYAWQTKYITEGTPKFSTRERLYAHIHENYIGTRPLNYFEMGVWYGAAIKFWNRLDKNRISRYFGFDTFKGLPEVWQGLTASAEAGTFDVGGSIDNVKIDDNRVTLIEGLFQDTVPHFLRSISSDEPRTNILHIDSDLYSSALFCLTAFDPIMKTGDIIIFDEFSSMDEFWALSDYEKAYRKNYVVIGYAGSYFQHVAIQLR